ncbi:GatB/YqeY domain-containing protein [Mangrovibrevibacter kandeliae]|uniref:GatB/YqeY domain-containing protein n=1 Tax=Mangrovibrevibacter kandeliae TaxID=2968473 RepID=UPI0021174276|nr:MULTISPECIES: GatB/YqeY domain-containing protein [unclassified Aurantimonas]MCQ8784123.1 GatB/YqeY domain-containing protein [Aurantimonas sp. CSK15Z-1]MCW4116842.1 GatB/YqeY domain-containing protein [Aurantimonas sp. MSK8Z-1]
MREVLADALSEASKGEDRCRLSMLRLIHAAIKDRDLANRSAGRDPLGEDEILQVLFKMIAQRKESAAAYEAEGRSELAAEERDEIEVIRSFLPPQLDAGEVEAACRQVVEDTDAKGLRDVGRCINALKERYPGQMDFGKASTVVKTLLT